MLNLSAQLKRLEKLSIDNSPMILTAIGVAGVVGTAYLAWKAGRKSDRVLQEVTESAWGKDREPTLQEKFEATYKFYIPAAVTGGVTIAAIISANRIGSKRTAAIAAAYTITEQAFSEYREKVVDRVGTLKERGIRDEIAQDHVNRAGDATIVIGDGNVLCYDNLTGRYFQSTMEDLKRAENVLNHKMLSDGYASLSDYYELIGLPATELSEELGWTVDRMLNIEVSATVAKDGKPCLVLDFSSVPVRGYHRFH